MKTLKEWLNQLLDLTVVFSFDHSGFLRHCPAPLPLVDLSGRQGIVTGASSGIGLAVARALIHQGMSCQLIARHIEKIKETFVFPQKCASLDMGHLRKVYSFSINEISGPIDLLIHNAGGMPNSLQITEEGFEHMFASQVIGPFILTKTLADSGKLRPGCRVIFVSSGGMYLQKLDLTDLLFQKKPYNKYTGYANAKRAQVILSELFSKNYPDYHFSAMHPGWADTSGVQKSMPLFRKFLKKRLRSAEEGADTLLWLATAEDYPNGQFWFDRKLQKTTIFKINQSSEKDEELLWNTCDSILRNFTGPLLKEKNP